MDAKIADTSSKLWMLSAMVSKSIPGGLTRTLCQGYRISASEDEARGSFVAWVFSVKPEFSIDNVLCMEIPREAMCHALGIPKPDPEQQDATGLPSP